MIEDAKRAVPRFNGMTDAVRTIIHEEGVMGIYRGVGPVVSASIFHLTSVSES